MIWHSFCQNDQREDEETIVTFITLLHGETTVSAYPGMEINKCIEKMKRKEMARSNEKLAISTFDLVLKANFICRRKLNIFEILLALYCNFKHADIFF